ncbi:MAG: radical SAM protein [Syntrophobacteria bacterium]
MITKKISLREVVQGTRKLLLMKAGKTLFSLNLEVTQRCNLRCTFCDYWKCKGPENRLEDYTPIVRHLNPLHLTITGGEPLLRSDLEKIVHSIRTQTSFVYMNLITNGSLLSIDRALSLWHAGLNQLSVSLDFPDERHDRNRGKTGLWRHLQQTLPRLAETEIDNLGLNTVIMKENLGDLLEIARTAKSWGFKVSYSTYNPFKSDNPEHLIPAGQLKRLEQVIGELITWKRQHGNITNSDFYLNNIPGYFRGRGISGCLAGRKWVQVSPEGTLRRCSDKEDLGDWREFKPNQVPFTSCRECWYACRGEAEAPLGLRRILELNR